MLVQMQPTKRPLSPDEGYVGSCKRREVIRNITPYSGSLIPLPQQSLNLNDNISSSWKREREQDNDTQGFRQKRFKNNDDTTDHIITAQITPTDITPAQITPAQKMYYLPIYAPIYRSLNDSVESHVGKGQLILYNRPETNDSLIEADFMKLD